MKYGRTILRLSTVPDKMHETAFPISIATDPDLLYYIFPGREATTGNTSAARTLKMSGNQ